MGSPAKKVWVPRHKLSFCAWKVKGSSFDAKSSKKTGTDAKVTESSSAGCWQKWPKKPKSAGFGPKIEKSMTSLVPRVVPVACGRASTRTRQCNTWHNFFLVFMYASYLKNCMTKYMTMALRSIDLTMAKNFSAADGWYCSRSAATWASSKD